MGTRHCCNGHEIKLPWYGVKPECNDCQDIIQDYAGLSEDDVVTDPNDEEHDCE